MNIKLGTDTNLLFEPKLVSVPIYPRLILAGTNSRVGKTTLTIGLILALKKRGLKVQPFKAGPDYIDPSYHSLVSGRPCRNLDTWMLSKDAVLELFERQARFSDISIIEGAMGLYDGLRNKDLGSTSHLAKLLGAPVILIVDASSLSRSAGALVLGYKEFDKQVDIQGVILNNIGSPTHYHSAKESIQKKAGLPVLGFLPRDKDLILPERHLGLIPTDEKALLDIFAKKLLLLIEENIAVDRILKISRKVKGFTRIDRKIFAIPPMPEKVTIAIAKDPAFNFYYQDNLDILKHYGAKLIEFSPLHDKLLPPAIDGLYIGGGFPELFARQLSLNSGLKGDIYRRAKEGMPIYAECGGLMYLAKNLADFKNKPFPMVGVFDASVKMGNKLKALGYVTAEVLKRNILSRKAMKLKAHVFHWSYLDQSGKKERFAYILKKDRGIAVADGLCKWNVLASYSHLHFGSDLRFAKNFIQSCLEYKGVK